MVHFGLTKASLEIENFADILSNALTRK